jgi:hypothetical protein
MLVTIQRRALHIILNYLWIVNLLVLYLILMHFHIGEKNLPMTFYPDQQYHIHIAKATRFETSIVVTGILQRDYKTWSDMYNT